jgi:cyclopropane fatty-acyl-phospholipid synthase-like methyltransferase
MTKIDHFRNKAEGYEEVGQRVRNVDTIANAVKRHIQFQPGMHIMDFGSGTGLLLERIAPLVDVITAVDVSPSMNAELEKKRAYLDCRLEMIETDLSTTKLERKFDGIISSMTMHHIQDIPAMLAKFYSMLNVGGFIALADLDTEDGSFHSEDTGVCHNGFDRDEFAGYAKNCGFNDISMVTANTIHKPHGDFSIFLMTAYR